MKVVHKGRNLYLRFKAIKNKTTLEKKNTTHNVRDKKNRTKKSPALRGFYKT